MPSKKRSHSKKSAQADVKSQADQPDFYDVPGIGRVASASGAAKLRQARDSVQLPEPDKQYSYSYDNGEAKTLAVGRREWPTESINAVISKLEGLAEMFPGVIRGANASVFHPNGETAPSRTTAAVEDAIKMLREFRDENDSKVRARSNDERRSLLNDAWENGHRVGVQEEQTRAKEDRRGRN